MKKTITINIQKTIELPAFFAKANSTEGSTYLAIYGEDSTERIRIVLDKYEASVALFSTEKPEMGYHQIPKEEFDAALNSAVSRIVNFMNQD